eukprot:NODE_6664_length_626_cov_48.625251_g6641_i0.p2 GENE.NODE_6664_length_626_cov_48.625251_g6641_i0~~NODE_6664_length_626_cov_48.625251_g6641_i0.p2  ORF type:complete len:114 (+),score=1.69 NODE_6664_length_626_cov_48.625251_g6641_i0:28-369(+)
MPLLLIYFSQLLSENAQCVSRTQLSLSTFQSATAQSTVPSGVAAMKQNVRWNVTWACSRDSVAFLHTCASLFACKHCLQCGTPLLATPPGAHGQEQHEGAVGSVIIMHLQCTL